MLGGITCLAFILCMSYAYDEGVKEGKRNINGRIEKT
jgi:hypothetical protein